MLLSIALLLSFISNGQVLSNADYTSAMKQWTYVSGGNPIDGYQRKALRMSNENGDDELGPMYILDVESTASSIKIENSSIRDGDNRDDISVSVLTRGSFENLDEILMYFDNEKTYYKVNFRAEENILLWWNATETIDTGFISRFNFIEKLKSKTKVFFRFNYLDGEQINASFTLNGSAAAINKVVDLSNLKNEDYKMDFTLGLLKYQGFIASEAVQRKLKLEGLSSLDFSTMLMTYLGDELGKYSLAIVNKFEYTPPLTSTSKGYITVYDLNDKMVLKTGFRAVLDLMISKHINQGLQKFNSEDYNGAIADLTKAIELDPANINTAYLGRGMSKIFLQDYNGAIADLTKAIELEPQRGMNGYKHRGIAKEYLNDLKGACADWTKAAELGDTEAAQWVADECN